MTSPSLSAQRATTLGNRARWLLRTTVAWNAIEAIIAVSAGVVAGSVALVGFGLDSLVEVFAASVVLWQMRGVSEDREQRALRLIAWSFFALAVYVTLEAIRELVASDGGGESDVGIALAAVSLVVMPALAVIKRRTARALGSATLLAESAETFLCASLSLVLLVGLLANAALGWWWADPIAALIIAGLAVREGREAWVGDGCAGGRNADA